MISKRLDKSLSALIKEADTVFSEYIRMKARDQNGFIVCFVCQQRVTWRRSHAMHFIDRDQMPVRYDEMNVHAGCYECNVMDSHHLLKYARVMKFVYGDNRVLALNRKARSLQKFMRHELLELIDTYKQKLKELR